MSLNININNITELKTLLDKVNEKNKENIEYIYTNEENYNGNGNGNGSGTEETDSNYSSEEEITDKEYIDNLIKYYNTEWINDNFDAIYDLYEELKYDFIWVFDTKNYLITIFDFGNYLKEHKIKMTIPDTKIQEIFIECDENDRELIRYKIFNKFGIKI